MSTILLVDDEYPAIEAIRSRVDWEKLGISEVLTADSVEAAREQFAGHTIELLLCDIEMPGENGMDLLQWIRTYSPETIGVFLTCHADFKYAKEAVRMGAFDYLLKPAPIGDIEEVLGRALSEWEKRTKRAVGENLWKKNETTVLEHFWWDVLNNLMPEGKERIAEQIAARRLSIDLDGSYLLVSCVIKRWNLDLTVWEKYDLDFTVRNILGEVYAASSPFLVTDTTNRTWILFAGACGEKFETGRIQEAAEKFQQFLKEYFQTMACFYIGIPCRIEELSDMCRELASMEKSNVSYDDKIYHVRSNPLKGREGGHDRRQQEHWKKLLLEEKGEELCRELKSSLKSMVADGTMNAETLLFVYHDVLQVVYSVLAEYQISVRQLLKDYETEYEEALKSTKSMEEHLEHIVITSVEYMKAVRQQEGVVGEMKRYIEEHLSEDLSRDTLARQFYLNPNYMARLFRNKTGSSLVDYITKQKIGHVKKLLLTTDLPVSSIAGQMGYTNMPYFSKVFKKETGCSPVEYRKKK